MADITVANSEQINTTKLITNTTRYADPRLGLGRSFFLTISMGFNFKEVI